MSTAFLLFLGLLSLGDIDVRGCHPIGFALGIAQGYAARQNPAVSAVRLDRFTGVGGDDVLEGGIDSWGNGWNRRCSRSAISRP
jgi:hypothetical protein